MTHTCKHCQSTNLKKDKAKPPHLASLICGDCQRWQKFLTRAEINNLEYGDYEEALQRNREDNQQLRLW